MTLRTLGSLSRYRADISYCNFLLITSIMKQGPENSFNYTWIDDLANPRIGLEVSSDGDTTLVMLLHPDVKSLQSSVHQEAIKW